MSLTEFDDIMNKLGLTPIGEGVWDLNDPAAERIFQRFNEEINAARAEMAELLKDWPPEKVKEFEEYLKAYNDFICTGQCTIRYEVKDE